MDKFSYKILDRGNLFVNQIRPHKNKWAWDLFITGSNNNWNPNKIPMSDDIKQWADGSLSEDEKLVIKRCLGFFAGAESLVSNNILLNIFEPICDGECRQYLFRQIYEECYSEDTEVLTDSGWKFFKDVSNTDQVLQVHEGIGSFVTPLNFIKKEFKGDRGTLNETLDTCCSSDAHSHDHTYGFGRYCYLGRVRSNGRYSSSATFWCQAICARQCL
jgi:hypothetical protein